MATTSEPWVLIPLLYARRRVGIEADYQHEVAAHAIHEFVEQLPQGEDDFNAAIRAYATTLYSAIASSGTSYFLDKTPRYSLVADELVRAFPEASYVFLWRDPLSVVASIANTWGHGRWTIHRYEPDLRVGLPNLIEASQQLGDRAMTLRYEDLASEPQETTNAVFRHLGLDPEADATKRLGQVQLRGVMGD